MSTSGYIIRAELRPGAVAAILANAASNDDGHALVWSLFEHLDKGDRRFLYREEGPGRYLVVSTVPPGDAGGVFHVEHKPYEPDFSVGDRLSFALRVNPAVAIREQGKRGRRTDAVMHARAQAASGEQRRDIDKDAVLEEWLRPRLMARGADLQSMTVSGWTVRTARRPGQGRHNLAVADIEGMLTVTDPAAFTPSLFAGYGKARAYGCGLLLVRRA